MTMPMSSRRSFVSTATVAAAASVSGCAVTAPAAAAICRAAPYVPAVNAPPLANAVGAAASSDAELLKLCAEFHRHTATETEIFERLCSQSLSPAETAAADAEYKARYAVWADIADACYAIQPSTVAGALALLDVVLERDAANIDDVVLEPIRHVRDALAMVVQS